MDCQLCRHQHEGGAQAAFVTTSECERPSTSAWESQPEASTSGSYWDAGDGARSWAPARDTGIQLAAAEEYNPDADDVRNAMQKYLPEGEKRRVLGALLLAAAACAAMALFEISFT